MIVQNGTKKIDSHTRELQRLRECYREARVRAERISRNRGARGHARRGGEREMLVDVVAVHMCMRDPNAKFWFINAGAGT
jgi:hypothetical protein